MAKLSIHIHAEAHIEENEAFLWYLDRSPKAAEAFLQEIDTARRAIQTSPHAWSKYLHGTRRYLLKRFPYVIVYRVTDDRIEIVAVAHGRRKQGYWFGRLTPSD